MYAVLKSFGLKGLNGFPVEVEADISGGMPALSIVGLPDSAVRESGDRVHAALKNLGFKWPDRRITINLAPADVRKTGPVYDLPLLLAVLAASGQLEPPPKDTAFLGELALDGSLRPVSGVLPMALEAAASGVRALYVPAENAAEAAEAVEARCRSILPQRPVRSWMHCGASSPSCLRYLSPSTLPMRGTTFPISLTSAASRWPAGRWSSRLRADTTSCSSVLPAPANPCWPAACPASCLP